jgi:hypothetical protein
MVNEPLDLDAVKRDGMIAHVDEVAAVFQGRKPICRASYKSKCCLGPVDVYHGGVTFAPNGKDWSVAIERVCVTCGHTCEGVTIDEPVASAPKVTEG